MEENEGSAPGEEDAAGEGRGVIVGDFVGVRVKGPVAVRVRELVPDIVGLGDGLGVTNRLLLVVGVSVEDPVDGGVADGLAWIDSDDVELEIVKTRGDEVGESVGVGVGVEVDVGVDVDVSDGDSVGVNDGDALWEAVNELLGVSTGVDDELSPTDTVAEGV